MARVLITGGAGFIGSHVAAVLNDAGHAVTLFDNLLPQVHGTRPHDSQLLRSARQSADLVVGDVTDRRAFTEAIAGKDVVIHLAAETGTGQSMYAIDHYSRVNVGGTALLLDILANEQNCVSKVVIASSRSIYGEGRYFSRELGYVFPDVRRESDLLAGRFEPTYPGDKSGLQLVATTEDSKIHPSSVYGITKANQESLVMTVCPTLGIAAVGLRYQNVYGPGQSLANPYTGILSIFSSLIMNESRINVFEDGEESRDFVFIDDVARVTAQVALDDAANNQVLNIGSGAATTVKTVVDELMRAYNKQVPVEVTGNFRVGDIRHNVADLARARKVLGYESRVSFREGVTAFAEWVQTQEILDGGYDNSLQEMRSRKLLK